MDENNQKMSKSVGNVVNPKDVIEGNKRKVVPRFQNILSEVMFVCDQKFSAHGADVARLWAAGSDYYKDISVGPNIMKQFQENFRKVCNL